ncbi:MAG: iron-containing alcohol dehydrogenase [Clostridia bacterium]|nr:iron-containing alcohol dehydrogenase [Clostridia bacterium]
MKNFVYQLPTKFLFGRGMEREVGAEARALGATKALIVYGGGSAVRSGLIGRVSESLQAAGVQCVELGGAQPNPRDTLVYKGIALAREAGCDFVLAVGGGSVIDTAKAISHGLQYSGDFWDFFCGKAKPEHTTPFGVVLTMSAAGSESSNSCVITQESTLTKRGLRTELNRPRFAIMNPELAMSVPPYQIACGATDILAHIMERYFTCETEVDLTDRLCEGAMQAIIRAARIAVRNPSDYDAQAQLMWGSTIAHNETLGVGRVSDFGSHQIEHELSALYDVAHGAGLAVVFPAWMRYQLPKNVMRFAQFAVRVYGCAMDFEHPERTAILGIEAHEHFLRDIGMPLTLKELGARTEDIPALAAKTKKTDVEKGTTGGAFPMKVEDIEAILRLADR